MRHSGKWACRASALCALLCGCSGGPEAPSATLPKLTDLTAALPEVQKEPEGSATELYARIARGALGCWFSPKGGMKKDYIYHAEADAPSRGGKAEIVVHMRDPSQPNPRGAKAYKVLITPKDETSATVTTENLRMPEAQGAVMTADVNRWAKGEQGCEGSATAAVATPAPEPAQTTGTVSKSKPATAAAKPKTPVKPKAP